MFQVQGSAYQVIISTLEGPFYFSHPISLSYLKLCGNG